MIPAPILPPVLLTQPVSTTLAKLVAKFAASVIDTGVNFAAGIVDTGGKYGTGCLLIPRSWIFEKIQNGPNGILWGWRGNDSWKNQKQKNLVTLSL